MNLNSLAMSKNIYQIIFDKKGHIALSKNGEIKTKKLLNKKYNPEATTKFIEYWECCKCFREAE